MRNGMIVGAGLALVATGGVAHAQRAEAQRAGASYDVPGRATLAAPTVTSPVVRPVPPRVGVAVPPVAGTPRRARWGSKIGGRWWGGANAPGGWAGYRRPGRGWALPAYWVEPRFSVVDWSGYGLAQPPQGYRWTRYYDDAVLIDGRGSVYDSVTGVDWDRFDGASRPPRYASPGYDAQGFDGRRDERVYAGSARERRDSGVGGAVIGGVVGGVAGNVVAGRGNRLGGTLIGAGVGAAAGYAIDKREDRGRRAPPPPPPSPRYDGAPGYAAPVYEDGYDDRPRPVRAPGGTWVSPDGRTTVTTTGGGFQGSPYPGGPYPGGPYPGGSSTTVIVQSVPVTTTTTTTEYYDAVTYRRAVRKARPVQTKVRYVKSRSTK